VCPAFRRSLRSSVHSVYVDALVCISCTVVTRVTVGNTVRDRPRCLARDRVPARGERAVLVHGCATLRAVSAEAFGVEVQRRRLLLRMSRAKLARRAGLSPSGLANVEMGSNLGGERRWSEPRRETVIDVAVALGWDADEALAMAGQETLHLLERERIEAITKAGDSRDDLDRLWPSLSGPQRRAIVRVAETMIDPQAQAEAPDDVVVYRFEAANDQST